MPVLAKQSDSLETMSKETKETRGNDKPRLRSPSREWGMGGFLMYMRLALVHRLDCRKDEERK